MEDKMTKTLPAPPASPEAVLDRLDAIIRELQELRRTLVIQPEVTPTTASLTQRLSGILAPPDQDGTFDVLEEYHAVSDWERFS